MAADRGFIPGEREASPTQTLHPLVGRPGPSIPTRARDPEHKPAAAVAWRSSLGLVVGEEPRTKLIREESHTLERWEESRSGVDCLKEFICNTNMKLVVQIRLKPDTDFGSAS
jgi:hypothetical protein